jgi:hypothetical protein
MGFHGGKGDVRRPRLRSLAGHKVPLPLGRRRRPRAGLAGGR